MRILSLHQQFHEIHVYKFSSEHLSCYSIVSKEEISIWELKMRILSLHQQFHEIHVYKFSSEHLIMLFNRFKRRNHKPSFVSC